MGRGAGASPGYCDTALFRHGLTERGLSYLVQVPTYIRAHPHDTTRVTGDYDGVGRRPTPRYRAPAVTVKDLVLATGRASGTTIAWRHGSRLRAGLPAPMRSRFVFLRIRPAGRVLLSIYRGRDLPETWLVAEWPTGQTEPTKYWLSNLPANTPKHTLSGGRSCAGGSNTTTGN